MRVHIFYIREKQCAGKYEIPVSCAEIEVGSQVRELGDYCFCSFFRMESITMGNAVEWGNGVVKECCSLKFLGLPEGKEMLPGYFCDGCVQLEHISVPNTIVRLWDYVFDKCTTLQEVTLPDGVTDIGGMCSSPAAV